MPDLRLICFVALSAFAARAQSSGVQPPATSMALDTEATALTTNPAGNAFNTGLTLDYVRDAAYGAGQRSGDGLFLSGGVGPLTLGFGEEWLHNGPVCNYVTTCPRRTTWGLALRGGPVGLGVNWHTYSSSENRDLDQLSSIDLGALVRPTRWLSLAVVAQDFNRPQFVFSEIPRTWTAAVAFRPVGEIADLAVDMRFREGQASHADYLVTLDTKIVSGLRFVGQLGFLDAGNQISAQAGVQIDLAHVGVRYAPSFAENASSRHSMRVRLSSEKWDSLSIPLSHSAVLDLHKSLEPPRASPLDLVFAPSHRDPLAVTLEALRRVAADRDVKAVVLKGSDLPIGMGRAQEIRTAIEGLQAAGKKVLFYLESGGDLEYSVAVAADRIYVAPQAILTVNGFSATALFAAAGLDKLGVKAEFFRVGAYKNAPDLFTRSEMSGEQREVENAILDDLYARYVAQICERRHLDAAKVKAVLDKGLVSPQEAVTAGLIDGLLYPDQLEEEAGKVLGGRTRLEKVSLDEPGRREERWAPPPRIVVVRVEGDILRGEGGSDPLGAVHVAGSGPIAKRIREAADDPEVAAIVVRIDSPGGDGNASDLIWRELVRARKEKKKPVVASMGDVAASGGYYVAVGADEIWAEPQTITGSIGVFIGHFDAEELYGKLGLHMVTVRRGESADLFSTARDLTDKERAMMQAWVDGFYAEFVGRVAENRRLDKAAVDQVARGRVWTGGQALERKLVDHLGGLEDAVAAAKKRAGLSPSDEVELVDEVPAQVGLSDFAMAKVTSALPSVITRAARAARLLGEPGTIRAVLPYDLEVR